MAVKKIGEKQKEKTAILRITVPKRLLEEIRETKKVCKENGYSFDIKPDVQAAIEKAIAEARRVIEENGPAN
ncbi:MAG: hypothetical protein ACLFOY_18950 [Desulfatibacillaceae bacterium]